MDSQRQKANQPSESIPHTKVIKCYFTLLTFVFVPLFEMFDWLNWEKHFDQSITQDSFIKGREPCPFRIMDDCGGAFAMGCAGGAVYYYLKGYFYYY